MATSKNILLAALALTLAGCMTVDAPQAQRLPQMPKVTTTDITIAFGRIDRAWQLEYQKSGEALRYRIVESNPELVHRAIRQVFIDLGMPIQSEVGQRSLIYAENYAPTPLTQQEWNEVVNIEGPRAREIGGWFVTLQQDPKDYLVVVKATILPVAAGVLVYLDYELTNLRFQRAGITASKYAPPTAVVLASAKIWSRLEGRLAEVKAPKPRARESWEKNT